MVAQILPHLTLSASRVRCRMLDDIATIMVNQTFINPSDAAVTTNCIIPFFPAGKLMSVSITAEAGGDEDQYYTRKHQGQQFTDGVESFTLASQIPPHSNVVVTLEYLVRLLHSTECEWSFVLPDALVPTPPRASASKHLHVPDWDMPTVRSPSSLYDRASTGDDSVGAAFSAAPNRPCRNDEDVNWCVEEKTPQNDEVKGKEDHPPINATVEILVEAYMSKGIAHLTVSGRPLRKNVDNERGEIYLSRNELEPGEFTCTVRESRRTLMEPVLWRQVVQSHYQQVYNKLSLDLTTDDFTDKACNLDIVVLIDASTAVGTAGMINIRRGLKLLLNALPLDCRFNVLGFADNWKSGFFDSIRPYTKASFDTARSGIERIRETQKRSAQLLAPVLQAAVCSKEQKQEQEHHAATGRVTKIILVTGTPDSRDLADVSKFLVQNKITMYGVLLMEDQTVLSITEGGQFRKTIESANMSGGCCEYVTELDLLDQALLKQLRRCCSSTENVVVSTSLNLEGTLAENEVVGNDNDDQVRLTRSNLDANSFYFCSPISSSTDTAAHQSARVTVKQKVATCNGIESNEVVELSKTISARVIEIRAASGDRLIQLAAEDTMNNNDVNGHERDAFAPSLLDLYHQDQDHETLYAKLRCYDTCKTDVTRLSRDVMKAKSLGLSRPWQMALGDEEASSSEDDINDVYRNQDKDHDFLSSVPKRAIAMTANFDLVSQRLAKAIQFDGTVSWKLARVMLKLPKRSERSFPADLWATVLTMTYIKLQNRTDDPCWEMFLDKAWTVVRTMCPVESDRATLFQRAIRDLQYENSKRALADTPQFV